MITSEQIDKIYPAIIALQSELTPVKKDELNPHFGKMYADLASIFETIRPLLKKHGLGIIQTNDRTDIGLAETYTKIVHESNQWIESTLRLKPVKDDPQALGSAFTYGRRYAILALLAIVAEDDDANKASAPRQQQGNQNQNQNRNANQNQNQNRNQEQQQRPAQSNAAPPIAPKTSAAPAQPPKGFNVNLKEHKNLLFQILDKKGVASNHWDDIATGMHGRPMTHGEVDQVLKEYMEKIVNE